MPIQTVKNGLKAKKIKLPQMNFFLEKQLINFLCTYWSLSFCKILKKLLGLIQSHEDVPFSGLKWIICHGQNVFETNHYYYFHLPIGPFHCAKFLKNSSDRYRVVRMRNFWSQNGPFPLLTMSFKRVVNGPCFFHSCLSTCQKSKSRY